MNRSKSLVVLLTACLTVGTVATALAVKPRSSGPPLRQISGAVAGVLGSSSFLLLDGTTVNAGAGTALTGLSRLGELQQGDLITIQGRWYRGRSTFNATEVERLASSQRALPVDVVSVTPDLISTANGFEVGISSQTLFVGFTKLDELQPGISLLVIGSWDLQLPWLFQAATIELEPGPTPVLSGHLRAGLHSIYVGVITEARPNRLVVDDTFTVETNASTLWYGSLSSQHDLAVGQIVALELLFGETIEALWVKDMGLLSDCLLLSGTVTAAAPGADTILSIATGETIAIDTLTVLDGAVNTAEEIMPGMLISTRVLPRSTDYLALDAQLSTPVMSTEALGFTDEELISEALILVAEGTDPVPIAAEYGATIADSTDGSLVYLFTWSVPITEDELLAMAHEPDVVEVEPNYPLQNPDSATDPESIRRRLIAVDAFGTMEDFTGQITVDLIAVTKAHERTIGSGTTVAVIDTGIDHLHPIFANRIAPGGWDFVDNDSEPWETSDGIDQDGDGEIDEAAGHGTFVAGLVLLTAPGTAILPFRALDDEGHGTNFDTCRAVLAAVEQGADVINMSFAYDRRGRILDHILMEASLRGIVLVSGAGNSATNKLPYPAYDSRVIAVAAANQDGTLAEFSNWGKDVAIAAPGVDLYSATINQAYGVWSGTSMAAPLVAGTSALLLSVNPLLNPEQVEEALIQSTIPLSGVLPQGSDFGLLQVAAALDLIP